MLYELFEWVLLLIISQIGGFEKITDAIHKKNEKLYEIYVNII